MRVRFAVIILYAVGATAPALAGPPRAIETTSSCQGPIGAAACGEARYPFDAQDAWMHGYFQEVPAYGGYCAFRPYNYKHVVAQSQIAARLGMSPTAPYSQQLWQRSRSQTATTRISNIRPVSYQR